jgi:hypothetical protein
MSAGELFDLIRPAVTIISALVSTWVLISARKHFRFWQALSWAIATFFLPFVVLPLYLSALLIWHRPKIQSIERRFLAPFLYIVILLGTLAVYTRVIERPVDVHLSRAALAKVNSDPATAIREYREALKLEDDPHTHKLQATELENAGYLMEAITEFRTAELGGEPDDTIHFRLGVLLKSIDHTGESILEFKKFAMSDTCLQIDNRCEEARQIIEDFEDTILSLVLDIRGAHVCMIKIDFWRGWSG